MDKYLKSLKLMVLKKQMGIFLLMAGVLALTKAWDIQILPRSCHVPLGCLKETSYSSHAGAGSTWSGTKVPPQLLPPHPHQVSSLAQPPFLWQGLRCPDPQNNLILVQQLGNKTTAWADTRVLVSAGWSLNVCSAATLSIWWLLLPFPLSQQSLAQSANDSAQTITWGAWP